MFRTLHLILLSLGTLYIICCKQQKVKYYMWRQALDGAESWTLRKVHQKYVKSFEMWCWRMMEKISWTDRVGNEVLRRVKEKINILHTIKRRKANWIGHILSKNCLIKQVIEGKIKARTSDRKTRKKT